ncbi:TfuA-like protein [Sorangium sp. KYC3313]|uniref:TfuA-like protein n=1 Tax=Sorangium sp. KYC3313 TaxID=3449740 RepID=UPI003F88AA95
MKIYVFTGPTLAPSEARAYLDATYLPPAAQGDVYSATLDRPVAIGIIDGYFERVPAVWHKEVLWAMSQGIHVLGSASMGALRAAELTAFGMEGVGAIYEAFARGELEDDDEVAVAHRPSDDGYKACSEAMVNVRSTLRAAAAAGAVDEGTRDALERIAKRLFYAERTWPLLLEAGRAEGLARETLEALRAFLPRGRVDQKRLDAIAMLEQMSARFAGAVKPKAVRYRFQHTNAWEHARRAAERRSADATATDSAGAPVPDEALVEELRLAGTGTYQSFAARASGKQRLLAAHGASSAGLAEAALPEQELLRWYFEEQLGQPVPDDLAAYAHRVGFDDVNALRRALALELLYVQWTGRGPRADRGA